jgi:cell division cycle 20-like protein 1 (cofactor of APC complex)
MLQVSTHGNLRNHVIVWRYPSLKQLATLTGHSSRVLYMAVSPDGETVVTGGGDETVRLWNVFNEAFPEKVSAQFIH